MKRLLTLFGILAMACAAFAQTPIIVAGNVTNSTTMQPVANVMVIIQQAGGTYVDTAYTDNNGDYADTTTVFATQGAFMASITDCNGNTVTSRGFSTPILRTITIDFDYCPNSPPGCISRFAVNMTATGAYQFSATASGGVGPYTYAWNFGDSNIGTGMNTTHTYTATGVYTICLIVNDAAGCADTTCQTIRVVVGGSGGNCAADFSVTNITNRNTVTFADASTPAGGPASGNTYAWDFGDGNTSAQQNPQHTYRTAGIYRVCLIFSVRSATGVCIDTTCKVVRVNQTNTTGCQANFVHRTRTNGWVQFTDFSRPQSTLTSISSWSWNFGDGNTSTAQNPRHQYNASGIYRVCLIYSYQPSVMGPVCTDTVCRAVAVRVTAPAPCVAQFMHRQTATGAIGFLALRSNNSLNNTYSWDFGDGNTATGNPVSHTYAASGTYTACLIVNCGNGNADTTCRRITIGSTGGNSNDITGQIFTSQRIPANNATVYLITLDSQAGTLTAIDSANTNPNGIYSFTGLTAGDYRIKAALKSTDPLYSSRIPTYHSNALHWSFANVLTLNGSAVTANITLIAGNNPGGPGFIGGLITQGANKVGDPLPNVSLILTDENDVAFTHTVTDANGDYSFANLPYGTYRVYIEVIGKDYLYQTVTITEGSTSVTNINFEVGEQSLTTSIENILIDGGFSIAPNPASNELRVSFELSEASDYEIQVYNMMGQVVLATQGPRSTGTQSATLNIADLPNGFYTVRLAAGKQHLSKKLTVVK
ncbi:MAG: PKD domain-containing protein [Bacteroidia bacterium]